MGEAKNRLEALGTTRRLRIERADIVLLVNFLTQPDPATGKGTPAGDRIKRRAIASAFDELGALTMWRVARKNAGPEQQDKIIAAIPAVEIRTVSVEAIRTIQSLLEKALDQRGAMGDALNLGDFEDMLEGALAGSYTPEELEPVDGLVSVPAEEAPATS